MSIKSPWGMTIHTLQRSRPTQTTASLHRGDTEDIEDLQHQALPLHCLETSIPASGNSNLALCDGLSLCDFLSRKSFRPIKLGPEDFGPCSPEWEYSTGFYPSSYASNTAAPTGCLG